MTVDPKRELARELYLQGKKYQEIADEVGVSLSTVKSWATRYWRAEKLQPKKQKVAIEVAEEVATKRHRGGQPATTMPRVRREISTPSSTAFFVRCCRRRHWNWWRILRLLIL